MPGTGLVWDLLARDQASPAFLRLSKAADEAAASTARAQKSTATFSAAAGRTGAVLTKSLTLPLLAVGAVGVDQAAKWQKSMTLIQTAGGETAAKTAVLSKGLLKLAADTGTGLAALGEGIYTVAKAGSQKWSATDQLTIMKAAAQAAKAENVDLGTATNALTSVMMSYHLGASKAVATQNELIVGAGAAKTTMQEYAASLATVVPVASAAGVQFDQVAGAIATLTQHGTSAAEATQELAFTIRNLQAPNNVAVSAMNQLGISSVNVSKNLGKRGLTGTLAYIESKLPKSGLVYLTTMKRMEAGTADLTAMQSKMSPTLAKLSKQYLDGTLGLADYRKQYRSMGAASAAQGTAFEALSKRVLGYNDNIKNGTPAQKTMAAELKAIFGGAVGLNTALQLGGENLDYFNTATKRVAAAAADAGTNVLGWQKTQDTFAVKVDKAKASLQVFEVNIGNALLPLVTKIVDGVSKAVTWFENLSGTDKKLIGWSAVVLAALGPILSIGSRIGLAARSLALFSGASVTMAATVGASMQRLTGALAGAGLVYAGTQTGGKVGGIMGLIGGGLTGASIGSFFGPLGTAIGGIAGAAGGLALSFLHSGDAAQSAAQKQEAAARKAAAAVAAQQQAVDNLTASIQADSDAIGMNTRAQVANDLQKSGALAAAQRLNISPRVVTSAALGSQKAQQQISTQVQQKYATGGIVTGSTLADLSKLTTGLANEGVLLGRAGQAADLHAEALGKLSFATRTVTDQYDRYNTTLTQATVDGRANIKFIGDHVAALDQARSAGKLTDAQWASSLTTLQAQMTQYGYNTEAVKSYIAGFAKVPKSVITKLLADPKVANSALGDVLRSIGKVPAAVSTKLDASDGVTPVVSSISSLIDSVSGKKITLNASKDTISTLNTIISKLQTISRGANGFVSVTTAAGQSARSHYGYATGGIIHGPGTGTSDTAGVFALSDGEAVIPARAVSAHLPLVKALIAAGRGKAAGGIVRSGKRYEFNGYTYSSLTAAQNAESSIVRAILTEISALNGAFRQTAQQIKSTTGALVAHARAVGASGRYLSVMGGEAARLAGLANRQASLATRLGSPSSSGVSAYDRLAAAQGNYGGESSAVSSSILGQFDLTQAGPNGILATVTGQVNSSRTFLANLKKLKARGLDAADIADLAGKGPVAAGSAVAQLLQMSGSQLATIRNSRSALAGIAGQTGALAAQSMYGGSVASAQSQVDSLIKQQKANEAAMKALTARLQAQADRVPAVEVYIDGKKATASVARAVARRR